MGFGPPAPPPLWIHTSVSSTLLVTKYKRKQIRLDLSKRICLRLYFIACCSMILAFSMSDHLELQILSPSLHNQSVHMQTTKKKTQIRPRGYKLFSCFTQLSTKFFLLINVKMPTIVGILTFISKINTASEKVKARNFLFVGIIVFMNS